MSRKRITAKTRTDYRKDAKEAKYRKEQTVSSRNLRVTFTPLR